MKKMFMRLAIYALILHRFSDVECRENEVTFQRKMGYHLGKYLVKTLKENSEFDCSNSCVNEPECASVNFKVKGEDEGLCELNSRTLDEFPEEARRDVEYVYLQVLRRNCKDNEDFSDETRRCQEFFLSCKDILSRHKNSTDGIYRLKSGSSGEYYDVYCQMTDIGACGAGGWTLAMKLNGTKNTFTYDSPLWTNNETYAIQDGLEGLTEKESKLASYWNTPFTKICMGMSYNGTRKWMTFNYAASSLYSVIADGQFRPTTAGRAAWKSLIVESSLQYNCNREGFNVRFNGESAMRIGIVSNNERDCASCDSWIGISRGSFTTDGTWHSRMVCGNHASHHSHDNGIKNSVTFGYIFVQ